MVTVNFGMFGWFWEFLYLISEIFLRLINLITLTCNKISGIDSIYVDGESTTLLEYLFGSSDVRFAFIVAASIGVIFTFLFTVIQIIINFTREKTEETPITIVKKSVKNIFTAMLVPLFMYLFFLLGNATVKAMYQATSVGTESLSQYLFSIFAEKAIIWDNVPSEYTSASEVFMNLVHWNDSFDTMNVYIDLSNYDFMYSYIIGAIVVWALLSTALMLVERVLSLCILFIISPFVIASSTLDDGARFKNWREQVLIKFFTGFGAIIGINVYLLCVKLVTSDSVSFFGEGFVNTTLDTFLKLIFIAGGAVCMKQVQAIIGNIISTGAGDKSLAENERSNKGFTSGVGSVLSAPFRGIRSAVNFGKDVKNYDFGNTVAKSLGFKNDYDYKRDFGLRERTGNSGASSGNYNGNIPNRGTQAMLNGGNNNDPLNSNNNNQQQGNDNSSKVMNNAKTGQDMVNSVIANSANEIK